MRERSRENESKRKREGERKRVNGRGRERERERERKRERERQTDTARQKNNHLAIERDCTIFLSPSISSGTCISTYVFMQVNVFICAFVRVQIHMYKYTTIIPDASLAYQTLCS